MIKSITFFIFDRLHKNHNHSHFVELIFKCNFFFLHEHLVQQLGVNNLILTRLYFWVIQQFQRCEVPPNKRDSLASNSIFWGPTVIYGHGGGDHTSYKRKGHSNLKLYRRTILHQLIPIQGKVVFFQGKRMRKEKKKKKKIRMTKNQVAILYEVA